jgi:hypothetical protein
VYPGYTDTCFFTYVPVTDKPGFGLIKHVKSGKLVHPYGGWDQPGANTKVVLHPEHKYAALWAVQGTSKAILHVAGSYWIPYGGWNTPGDNTGIVIYPE